MPKLARRRALLEPQVIIAIIVIMAGMALFVLYPLIKLLYIVFFPGGHFSFAVIERIVGTRIYLRGFLNSTMVAFWVGILSVIIGYIFAYAVTRANVPGKRYFNLMATIPMLSPPFLLAMGVILLFGYNGLITKGILGIDNFRIFGFKGLLLVETVGSFPLAYLTLKGMLSAMDPRLEDAALSLGASRLKTFLTVTLPLSLPGIANAFLLIFAFSLADFGNPILLAGSRFPILSVQAYLEITGMYNLERGAALALMLLVPSILAFILQRYLLAKRSYVTVTGKPGMSSFPRSSLAERQLYFGVCFAFSILLLLLLSVAMAGAFVKNWLIDNSFSLEHFRFAWGQGFRYLKDTSKMAIIGGMLAALQGVVIAFLVSKRKFIGKRSMEFISMLPFALPGTVVGIAYLLSYNTLPILLTGSSLIIIINFVYRYTPVGIRSAVPMLQQLSPSIDEASTNLGASSGTTFRKITLPLIVPSFFAALVYAFIRSMTAISAVVYLASPHAYVYTVFILDELSIGRLGNAAAGVVILSVVILAFIAAAGLILRRVSGKRQTGGGSMLGI